MTLMFCRVPSPSFTVTGASSFLNGKRRRRRKKFAHFGQTTTRPNPKARSPGGYKREEQQKAFAAHTHKSGKSSGLFWGRGKDGKWPLFVVKQGGGRLLRSHSGAGNGREGDTVRSFGLAQIGTLCRRGILYRWQTKSTKKKFSPPLKKIKGSDPVHPFPNLWRLYLSWPRRSLCSSPYGIGEPLVLCKVNTKHPAR